MSESLRDLMCQIPPNLATIFKCFINKGVFVNKLVIFVFFIFCATFAQANESAPSPYFQISKVTVEVLEHSEGINIQQKYEDPDPRTEVGDVIRIFREIIAFGKEIYEIVKAGKPVINTKYAAISVLPMDTPFGKQITPMDLTHWKTPKFVKFKVSYKNGYGAEVVSFIYNVNMSYGGKFEGKGSYITNAQVVPEKVTVAWGYTFNAKMSLVGLTNIGSEEEPLVGATLQLSYSVSTIVKEDRNNMTIFIAGDGTIQQM
jgi:hypothetical protein